jgi:arginase
VYGARLRSPADTGQPRAGVDTGPLKLIEAGLLDDIKSLGWDVDYADQMHFEPMSEEQDPPIGILKRPRLV